jgi:hypothetical protein
MDPGPLVHIGLVKQGRQDPGRVLSKDRGGASFGHLTSALENLRDLDPDDGSREKPHR